MKIKDDSNEKMYFTIIPNYILNHSTLWDREVYIQMKRITGDEGTCWTSQKTLADQCGISINRLKKSLKYLIANRWIRFIGKKEVGTKGGSQEVNEYKIIDLWKKNMEFYAKGVSSDDTPNTKGVSRDIPKGYHESAKGVSPRDDKEEPLNNIQLNNNNIAKETFAFSKQLLKMEKDQRHIQIIALYWKYKEFNFDNKEQYQSSLKRDLKPASALKGYSNDKISKVMAWLDKNMSGIKWTLETIHKYIDEDLSLYEEKAKQQYGSRF